MMLLQTTTMNVSEVCYACGFNSPAYFSKHFKLLHGTTPKDIQRQVEKT